MKALVEHGSVGHYSVYTAEVVGIVLCTSRAGSSPSSPGVPRARVRSSPLESLGGSRVLAGAVAAWALFYSISEYARIANIPYWLRNIP